jgi:hypothetical protein
MLNDMLLILKTVKSTPASITFTAFGRNSDKKIGTACVLRPLNAKERRTFSVYNDIRKKLIERGVPEAKSALSTKQYRCEEKELFQKTRKARSSASRLYEQRWSRHDVQDRLNRTSRVDCPWRPQTWSTLRSNYPTGQLKPRCRYLPLCLQSRPLTHILSAC